MWAFLVWLLRLVCPQQQWTPCRCGSEASLWRGERAEFLCGRCYLGLIHQPVPIGLPKSGTDIASNGGSVCPTLDNARDLCHSYDAGHAVAGS
jgi:hypothetical protein